MFGITPLMSIMQLRLAILSVLGSDDDNLLCLMGIKCSSWVQVNVGTSNRTCLNPMGLEEGCPSVASANQMVARRGVKCLKMGGWRECSRPLTILYHTLSYCIIYCSILYPSSQCKVCNLHFAIGGCKCSPFNRATEQ